MKRELSFTDLDQLSIDHLQAMLDRSNLSEENCKRIAYEIHIRSIELPKEWELNN
ncbi:hypothetical protein [Dysgonomonas macrotermitis]|uniref:Uncharacterized protein n=1 Tax=Dysgonomonas macrotermitis TaxID=1346286 RepID=A0A1M5C2F2_9BACT|nr:hypothetical protein [Dysgonomonas macrotermitis]SHF48845.1 hypothetical protein SAMN05444362_1073 [Dysgonomonas macrotermitis]